MESERVEGVDNVEIILGVKRRRKSVVDLGAPRAPSCKGWHPADAVEPSFV